LTAVFQKSAVLLSAYRPHLTRQALKFVAGLQRSFIDARTGSCDTGETLNFGLTALPQPDLPAD